MDTLSEKIKQEARAFAEAHGIKPVSDVEAAMRLGAMLAMEVTGKKVREDTANLERKQMVSNMPH